jgi:hypothetical protein
MEPFALWPAGILRVAILGVVRRLATTVRCHCYPCQGARTAIGESQATHFSGVEKPCVANQCVVFRVTHGPEWGSPNCGRMKRRGDSGTKGGLEPAGPDLRCGRVELSSEQIV